MKIELNNLIFGYDKTCQIFSESFYYCYDRKTGHFYVESTVLKLILLIIKDFRKDKHLIG